jgi:hypothetical protein
VGDGLTAPLAGADVLAGQAGEAKRKSNTSADCGRCRATSHWSKYLPGRNDPADPRFKTAALQERHVTRWDSHALDLTSLADPERLALGTRHASKQSVAAATVRNCQR